MLTHFGYDCGFTPLLLILDVFSKSPFAHKNNGVIASAEPGRGDTKWKEHVRRLAWQRSTGTAGSEKFFFGQRSRAVGEKVSKDFPCLSMMLISS